MPHGAGKGSLPLPDPRGFKELMGQLWRTQHCVTLGEHGHHIAWVAARAPGNAGILHTHTGACHCCRLHRGHPRPYRDCPTGTEASCSCVCLQSPWHRGVTVRRLGPVTTLLQEAAGSCIESGVPARHRRASPVPCSISHRELHGHWPGEGAGQGRVQAGGAARSLAGGGCRPGELHGHWPGEGAGQGSCTVTGRGRVQAGGGCRPGELHGHWPGEGAGQGSCTVTGRGRVQARGGCRPGVLHGHWLGEGAGQGRVQAGGAAWSLARGGCRPGELHGHWLGEGAGWGSCMVTGRGRVQVGGVARSLARGGCRPGELHGHWLGEGAGQGRVQAGGAARSLAGGGCRWGCWRAQGAAVTHFQEG
ncbi:unnamed protein product [Lepidochelys olivacea]